MTAALSMRTSLFFVASAVHRYEKGLLR